MNILGIGAEAMVLKTTYLGLPAVQKRRERKNYRNAALDAKIRSRRTKQECLLLFRAKEAQVRCPAIYKIDSVNSEITMEFIGGKKAKTFLNRQNFKKICEKIGQEIGKLHSKEIIHGDLTTDNIIIEGKRIAFVDFGLGFFSKKTEDFATDLLSMKKTFLSTHFALKGGFEAVLKGYRKTAPGAQKTIETIAEIEARTRYS